MKILKIHQKLSEDKEISLCTKCKGNGWNWSNLDFGDIPGDERQVKCSLCDGCGRVKTITVKADIVVPFNLEMVS